MRLKVVVLSIAGSVLLSLGLLFLAGSAGMPRRLVLAAVFGASGALLIGLGVRAFRRWKMVAPDVLEDEILELARRQDGEVTMAEIEAALAWRFPSARGVIESLVGRGTCRRAVKSSRDYLVFPELQPRLTVRFCAYCDREFPVNEATETCPSCGGSVETRVVVRSLSDGESFAMDG